MHFLRVIFLIMLGIAGAWFFVQQLLDGNVFEAYSDPIITAVAVFNAKKIRILFKEGISGV